jgi:hypothetical protein
VNVSGHTGRTLLANAREKESDLRISIPTVTTKNEVFAVVY